MASIEQALTSRIQGDASVGAVIGDRFYPMKLPAQVTLPAATYQKISNVPTHVHGAKAEQLRPRFQVTSWGATFSDAMSAANAIQTSLDGFEGTMGSGGNTKDVYSCLLADDRHDNSPEVGLYWVQRDYFIHHIGD